MSSAKGPRCGGVRARPGLPAAPGSLAAARPVPPDGQFGLLSSKGPLCCISSFWSCFLGQLDAWEIGPFPFTRDSQRLPFTSVWQVPGARGQAESRGTLVMAPLFPAVPLASTQAQQPPEDRAWSHGPAPTRTVGGDCCLQFQAALHVSHTPSLSLARTWPPWARSRLSRPVHSSRSSPPLLSFSVLPSLQQWVSHIPVSGNNLKTS